MTALAETSLSGDERAPVQRFVEELRARPGGQVHAVWLFGSRARGERPSAESDVDVLVLVDDASMSPRSGEREQADYDAWSAPAEEAQRAINLADRFLTAIEALFD
jgi:predicted nucleotidyltransferase